MQKHTTRAKQVHVEFEEVQVSTEVLLTEVQALFGHIVAAEARLRAAEGDPRGQREAVFGAAWGVYSFISACADDAKESQSPFTVFRLLMTALIDLDRGCSPPAFLQPSPETTRRRGAPPSTGRQDHIRSAAVACYHALVKAGVKKTQAAALVAKAFNSGSLHEELPQNHHGISERAVRSWAAGTRYGNRKRPATAYILSEPPDLQRARRFLREMVTFLQADQSFGRAK